MGDAPMSTGLVHYSANLQNKTGLDFSRDHAPVSSRMICTITSLWHLFGAHQHPRFLPAFLIRAKSKTQLGRVRRLLARGPLDLRLDCVELSRVPVPNFSETRTEYFIAFEFVATGISPARVCVFV